MYEIVNLGASRSMGRNGLGSMRVNEMELGGHFERGASRRSPCRRYVSTRIQMNIFTSQDLTVSNTSIELSRQNMYP